MRILYMTETDSPHDQRFLTALAATSHQIYALRQYPAQPITPAGVREIEWSGALPNWFDWRGWQRGITQLQGLLDKIQPDLVHAGPVQGPAFLTVQAGFHPLVTMSWGSDLLMKAKRSPWMRRVTRDTLADTDILLADCQTVADEAIHYGMHPGQIVQFPWGVDLSHFSPSKSQGAGRTLRDSLGWEEQFVILCNRSWSPLYGVDVLARAFADAVKDNPNLRLLLVGGGPQSEKIRGVLEPVSAYINLPGWLDRGSLPGAYGAADLFVSPSHCDGSSVSLLEALACGTPALVSDIPSNREWITPGETGDHFQDGNSASLCEKLLAMADDPDLEGYGRCARNLAERRANWKENFKKLLGAYDMASG